MQLIQLNIVNGRFVVFELNHLKPIGSMYAVCCYIWQHGSHQYTPVMLAYIPAPWIRHEKDHFGHGWSTTCDVATRVATFPRGVFATISSSCSQEGGRRALESFGKPWRLGDFFHDCSLHSIVDELWMSFPSIEVSSPIDSILCSRWGPSRKCKQESEITQWYIWENYNDLTATEPWESWLIREIIPNGPTIQVSEILQFTQIYA